MFAAGSVHVTFARRAALVRQSQGADARLARCIRIAPSSNSSPQRRYARTRGWLRLVAARSQSGPPALPTARPGYDDGVALAALN
ncbi:hypothetical protein CAI18_07870 [Xanthomonas citri pv. punicae]|nr:hypothetical protein CAI14_13315 [Xanthomonas citri pv. punicae]QCZ69127.1 hypothetical protein CAI17_10945 [Xanthomonas citri pv. punicae]QCZ76414.1 hypothetical protein XapA_05840 [Xanthomonas citri pv. punicae]QCZ81097.1 hypothetical protein XapB_09320 [Xanthomonas citri pv. punicae]QCZ85009.1 hypothetical protein CAI18_07870 [Xanthomonas citri pv. punicae]